MPIDRLVHQLKVLNLALSPMTVTELKDSIPTGCPLQYANGIFEQVDFAKLVKSKMNLLQNSHPFSSAFATEANLLQTNVFRRGRGNILLELLNEGFSLFCLCVFMVVKNIKTISDFGSVSWMEFESADDEERWFSSQRPRDMKHLFAFLHTGISDSDKRRNAIKRFKRQNDSWPAFFLSILQEESPSGDANEIGECFNSYFFFSFFVSKQSLH